MSVFSKMKQSRKAAKEHKVQVAEKEKDETTASKLKYRHVPTHAAVDALSGAPSSWKHEDRPKIREHHKRRSEMAISRPGSTLSTTSFMGAVHGSGPQLSSLPRNSSYNSYNPTWFDRTGDIQYTNEPRDRRPRTGRHHSLQDSGIGSSPLASHVHSEATSPVNSSGNSTTSSSDNLPEIKIASKTMDRLQPQTFAGKDIFQRLHTSTTRKLGEAPVSESQNVQPKPIANILAQEAKPKKQRWSLMGKRNAISAM